MERGDSLDDAKRWAVKHEVCGGAIEIEMRPTIALAQAGLLKPSEDFQTGQALTAAMALAQHISDPALREQTLVELQKRIDELNTVIRRRYGDNTTH